jgi:hypothetical protein
MNNLTEKLPNKVILAGIGYLVSEHEGLIIFSEDGGFYGTWTRISFSRPDKYSLWQVELQDNWNRVPASHIVEAYQIVMQYRGDDFGRPIKNEP